MQNLVWDKLSKKKKKELSKLKPILVLGPREISRERIKQLANQLLAKKPVIFGSLSDNYIPGLENSEQFGTLGLEKLQSALADLSINLEANHSLSTLLYPFRYSRYLLKEIDYSAVIGVYGSWHKAFHFTQLYYQLSQQQTPYKLVSSFVSSKEAKTYEEKIKREIKPLKAKPGQKLSDQQLINLVQAAATHSFDYTFQTGAVLAKDNKFLLFAHNRVLPYESYMLHQGSSKEKHFDPPQDLNHFDTIHAEVELILEANQKNISLEDTTLYINLLPCPTCAKMIARSPIKKIVYQHDHSQGYAFKLLQEMGKEVVRV